MDFNVIYEKYEKVKSFKEYIEYESEITANKLILDSYPFKEQYAKNQLSYLTEKYKRELNAYAQLQGNGMTIIPNPPQKSPQQIWNELNYINGLIPLFALERTGKSRILKKLIEKQGGVFYG